MKDAAIKMFLVGLGLATAYGLFTWLKQVYLQYRKGALYEVEEKQKQIDDSNHKLTDAELLDQANKGLGIGQRPQSGDSHKKG